MLIKQLKIENLIKENFEDRYIDEAGNEVWETPQDLKEFKALALDTINWQIGNNVKKAVGNTQTNLSASNAKAIALLAKLIAPTEEQINALTDLEKDSWIKLKGLSNGGYADSKLLNSSLGSVSEFIAIATAKATRIEKASSHDDVIAILNED